MVAVKTEKIASDQAKLTEDNSAMMKNVAKATEVLSLAQVTELNRLTQKIEPSGLLDL